MISLNLLQNTLIWTGWTGKRFIEKCPRQRVEYMQHTLFPTDVVKETNVYLKGFLKNVVPPLQLLPMI